MMRANDWNNTLARWQQATKMPQDSMIGIRGSPLVGQVIDRKRREIIGTISTSDLDLDNEVVLPSGGDFSYFPNMVQAVYLEHDTWRPIGVCRNMTARSNGLVATTVLSKSTLGEEVLLLMEEGVLRSFSIGFQVNDFRTPTDQDLEQYGRECQRVITSWKMLEYSVVAMPANKEASVISASVEGGERSWDYRVNIDSTGKMEAVQEMVTKGHVRQETANSIFGKPPKKDATTIIVA